MAIVLSLTLVVGVVSIFAPKNTTTTAMAKQKTVYDEIKLSKLSDKKLENVAKTALDDGAKAAKEVNSYKDEADYKAALNTAMTSYYKKNDKKQLKSFTKNLDNRAKDVVANYEKAAKERAKGDKEYRVGKILAIFNAGVTKKEIKDVCKSQDAKLARCFKIHTGEYLAQIDISLGETVKMASKDFSKFGFVEVADYSGIADPAVSDEVRNMTNDPYMSSSYQFDNMNVKGAWDYLNSHNHSRVKVAVLDTGCYADNQDIEHIITEDSYDTVKGKSVWDVQYDSKAYHGTAVAGCIAAESNNGKMVAGIASGYDNSIVDILAVPCAYYDESKADYRFDWYDLCDACDYALEHGAQMINMSLGSTYASPILRTYMKKLYDAGLVMFASAGNDSSSSGHYPSDFPFVISVGALDTSNVITYFSNYGKEVDICASGQSLPCLNYNNTVSKMQGTSFASPNACAVGAMMLSVNPDLTTHDIVRIMQNTDTKLPDTKTSQSFDYGLVNAEKCVKAADGYKDSDSFEGTEEAMLNVAPKASFTIQNGLGGYPSTYLNDLNLNSMGGLDKNGKSVIEIEFDKVYKMSKLIVHFPDDIKTDFRYYSSPDGVNYSNAVGGANQFAVYGRKDYILHDSKGYGNPDVKKIRLEFENATDDIRISEIEAWAKDTLERPADNCGVEEIIMAPRNLSVEILGYHKTKLTWDVNEKMTSRDYEYQVFDDGVLVGTTKDNSVVLNETSANGSLDYLVRAVYKGKYSDYSEYSSYVDWNTYQDSSTLTSASTSVVTTPVTTTEAPTTQPLTNLALGKPAVASSEENGGTKAEYAFDGNETTRWSSEWTDDEWIYVDLGKTCLVSQLEIKWETARASSYMVYTSQDKSVWAPCAQNTQNAENTTDTFSPRYARYVQIRGRGRNTGYGYSIFEMKVMGVNPDESTTVAPTTTAESTTLAPTTTVESTSTPETTTKRTRRIIPGGFTISTENVAAGKTAFASSEENAGVNADKVCDGDMGTRWSSEWTDDEWIVVDLGEVMPIAQVKLHWEAAYGKDYVVQFSEDGDTYYDKRTTTNNTLRDTIEAFPAEYTRYIRVKCSQRGTGYGYSLFEIEAFPAIFNGATTTVAPTTTTAQQFTNLALGKNATASTYENDSMSAVKAFDGDMGTRWASAWEDNQFIRVNLESQRYINHIVINWEAAYGKDYEIQLSNDGKIWNTKKTITNSDGGIDTVPVNDSAQFVRLVCVTRGTNYGFSIYEMAVMGY